MFLFFSPELPANDSRQFRRRRQKFSFRKGKQTGQILKTVQALTHSLQILQPEV